MPKPRLLTTISVNCLIPVKDDTVSRIQLAMVDFAKLLKLEHYGMEFKYFPPLHCKEVSNAEG